MDNELREETLEKLQKDLKNAEKSLENEKNIILKLNISQRIERIKKRIAELRNLTD